MLEDFTFENLSTFLNFRLIEVGNFVLRFEHLVTILFVLVAVKLLLWGLRQFLESRKHHHRLNEGQVLAIYQIVKYVAFLIAIAIILESIGIKITILIAGSAALLVGIGLGLQQVFLDFVSGIMILLEGTIRVGDVIQTGDFLGRVKRVGIRVSHIETPDNVIYIVPNSQLATERMAHLNHTDIFSRFHVKVGVAYGSDPEKVKRILLDCANEHSEVATKPEPSVHFMDFGEYTLVFELLFWSKRNFIQKTVQSDLRFLINKKFKKNGIEIPFPQRDIHIKEDGKKRIRKTKKA